MTGEQSARRWRDGGEGGGSTRISPVRSVSRDQSSPRPVGNIVELHIQAASPPRNREHGVVQTFPSGRRAPPFGAAWRALDLSRPRRRAERFQRSLDIGGGAKRLHCGPNLIGRGRVPALTSRQTVVRDTPSASVASSVVRSLVITGPKGLWITHPLSGRSSVATCIGWVRSGQARNATTSALAALR